MSLIGYARTSTVDQEAGLAAQIRDLTALGCDVIYNEQVSSVGERPEFEAAIASLKAGDTLVVTKNDRLARSLSHLLAIIDNLTERKVSLRILDLGLDTKTPTARLILNVMGSIAQFEREIMLERQREGIAKAQSEGKYKGAPPMPLERRFQIVDLYNQGLKLAKIAREVDVSRITVRRILKDEGIYVPPMVAGDRPLGVSWRKRPAPEIRATK